MSRILTANFFIVLSVLTGCSGIEPKPSSQVSEVAYKKNGLKLNILADSKLNYFNRKPHTLVIVVYQLSESDYFQSMISTTDGVGQLLESMPNQESFLTRRKLIIYPGESKTVYIDRFSGANYISVVSGYYSDNVDDLSYMAKIKLRERNYFFWRATDKDSSDTFIDIELGAERMTEISLNGNDFRGLM